MHERRDKNVLRHRGDFVSKSALIWEIRRKTVATRFSVVQQRFVNKLRYTRIVNLLNGKARRTVRMYRPRKKKEARGPLYP